MLNFSVSNKTTDLNKDGHQVSTPTHWRSQNIPSGLRSASRRSATCFGFTFREQSCWPFLYTADDWDQDLTEQEQVSKMWNPIKVILFFWFVQHRFLHFTAVFEYKWVLAQQYVSIILNFFKTSPSGSDRDRNAAGDISREEEEEEVWDLPHVSGLVLGRCWAERADKISACSVHKIN